MSLFTDTYDYWTKTPHVLADAYNAVGFAVSKTSFGSTTPMIASFARSVVNPNAPALTVTHSPADSGLTKAIKASVIVGGGVGKVTGKGGILIADAGGVVLDIVDPSKSVLSDTLLKYALIAGGAFALYKFGGEFVREKGAQFARSKRS